MDYWQMFFILFIGIGLFIFGMHFMEKGLRKLSGSKMQKLLEVLTTNPLMGVMVGALVTAVIQSSSAATVLVVGFVNAGWMDLKQAAGVIMGANIGTTVTAQLLAFRFFPVSLPAIGIGVILSLLPQNKKIKDLGTIVIGFGLLFLGMETMKSAMAPLGESTLFIDFTQKFSTNTLLGVFIGFALTGILQSSSATIGILQNLASLKLISLTSALPVLCGDNIGTCVTALISGVGANSAAKQAALFHFLFNVIGTILFLCVLPLISPFLEITASDPARQIANAHTLFNLLNTAVQLPFIHVLVHLVMKLIPSGSEGSISYNELVYLDNRLLKAPGFALKQVKKEAYRMGQLTKSCLDNAKNAFLQGDLPSAEQAYEKEKNVNELDSAISDYLSRLAFQPISEEETASLSNYLRVLQDLERMGDHAENIVEMAEFRIEGSLPFSPDAIHELTEMFSEVCQAFHGALEAFFNNDIKEAKKTLESENRIDAMKKQYHAHHTARLNKGICFSASGIVYLDILNNLERIGDHAASIAHVILQD